MVFQEEDTKKKKKGYERVNKYAQDAVNYLQLVSHDMYIAQSYSQYTESCNNLADDIVTSQEKIGMVERAIGIGRKGLEHNYRKKIFLEFHYKIRFDINIKVLCSKNT